MLTILDLFSGIGGFSLGLERIGGFRTVAFCERDPYAARVLNKHWPDVPVFGDVRELGLASLRAAGIERPDVVCGGFPCQDISTAGKGAGLDGERSGLWFEMLRIIEETRPRFVIAENVAVLRSRGLDTCLRGLAAIGYDAEWHCIPAAAVGAPHRRDRAWIVAYTARADSSGGRCGGAQGGKMEQPGRAETIGASPDVAYAAGVGLAIGQGVGCHSGEELAPVVRGCGDAGFWSSEPDVGRVANGVPSRVDRLRCLGNAVVPQIPELIGRAILRAHTVA